VQERDAVVASANERRVFAATSVGALQEPADVAMADDAVPVSLPPAIRRGGTALGRAVHAVLATMDLDDDDELTALATAHAATEGVADAGDVERRVRAALTAPVVLEARAATRRWRELYVAAPVGDRGRLVEGYVDLLFEDANGDLVVVDYKTDAEIDAHADQYRLQAATYAYALQTSLRKTIGRAVFVLCRPDGAVEREVDDLAAAVGDVERLVG
jgi:ATP-dependent helicase/nuclease subunit A